MPYLIAFAMGASKGPANRAPLTSDDGCHGRRSLHGPAGAGDARRLGLLRPLVRSGEGEPVLSLKLALESEMQHVDIVHNSWRPDVATGENRWYRARARTTDWGDVAIRTPNVTELTQAVLGEWWMLEEFAGKTSWFSTGTTTEPARVLAEQALVAKATRWAFAGPAWRAPDMTVTRKVIPSNPGTLALVYRWIDGQSLQQVPFAARRELLPRLIPPLLEALSACTHGDLTPGNIVLWADGRHFSLIDPAGWVELGPGGLKQHVFFETTPRYYPCFVPPVCSRGQVGSFSSPHIGDIMSIGIMYFEAIFSGRHPLDSLVQWRPSWLGRVSGSSFGDEWPSVQRSAGLLQGEPWIATFNELCWANPMVASTTLPSEIRLAFSMLELGLARHREGGEWLAPDQVSGIVELCRDVVSEARGRAKK